MSARLAALLVLSSCTSVQFQNVTKLSEGFDDSGASYVVTVQFEVLSNELPVQGLTARDLKVLEDDVHATSESLQEVERTTIQLDVTLLLDTSKSIYDADAMQELKGAAQQFVSDMSADGFVVQTWGFNNDVYPIEDLSEIDPQKVPDSRNRWTSLYYALWKAASENPDHILVVFSDGADNYSQNHVAGETPIDNFDVIEATLADRQIHAIGFGNIGKEKDRQGRKGSSILKQIT